MVSNPGIKNIKPAFCLRHAVGGIVHVDANRGRQPVSLSNRQRQPGSRFSGFRDFDCDCRVAVVWIDTSPQPGSFDQGFRGGFCGPDLRGVGSLACSKQFLVVAGGNLFTDRDQGLC